jgi:hypothetical protein
MASDIGNLYHLVFFAQDSPDRHIGGAASLEVAMMAVLPEFGIMRPFNLNWARELHLGQQELKDFIYTSGQPLELFVDASR